MAARRGPGPVAVLALLALLGPAWPLRGARAVLNRRSSASSRVSVGSGGVAQGSDSSVPPPQHHAEDVVTVASRFKQRYECRLPPAAVGPPPGPPRDPRLYNGSGVAELLRPMGTAPCLLKTKDWWTYEFCYGRHIQQYHLEESEIKGDVLVLGYYQSAFDWDDEAAKVRSKQHQLRRYHSQSYVNGSRCDLTGRRREAEVRYVQYVRAQVSDTKRKVEEISEELRTLDTRLWSDRDSEPPSQTPEATQDGAIPEGSRRSGSWPRRRPGEEEEEAAKAPPAPPGPMEPPSPEALPGSETPAAGEEEEEEDEEEEEEEEEEAGPLLAGLELLPREQVARLKEEVKNQQMEQEFDSIISEIVTAASGSEEEAEEAAQWLSEEDSRSLKEIFLSILCGSRGDGGN
ncbi:hypothetical protein DUI87_00415 [Hirundo rustica rustica]|uniref:Endoplasmic reticulum lectin n=1 Tax=Hirundo rustica rustica TaxID=333673 RepID=A0A3M0LUA1_HIRRU|nr:hypothetical protein DUI87_00415 [Hirundo rustica rustica]